MSAISGRKKVLVVDDDEPFCKSLVAALVSLEYEAAYATNGGDAIAMARDEDFDLALTDLVMGAMDGVDVCRELKKIRPNLKVALVSGKPQEIDRKLMAFIDEGGIDVYLRKPFLHDLGGAIEKALAHQGY